MKKILMSLAAVAALVSCVEEKGLELQDPIEGQVVIKATTDLTKTVISGEDPSEGLSVLWEDGDMIRVVFINDDSYKETDFTTTLSENSDKADFTGNLDDEITVESGYSEEGFAVYPASVWDAEFSKFSFTVPETQDGVVRKDENLASASVSLSDLREEGEVNAYFRNALALVRLYLPDGVSSVTLKSDNQPLAGTPEFKMEGGRIVNANSISWTKRQSVTVRSDESLPAVSDVLVLPAVVHNLTVTVTGTDGAVYEKTVGGKTFEASQCYTLDLTSLFQADPKTVYASPAGGEFVYEMVTTEDFTYSVSVIDAPSWVTKVETKGFHSDKIVLTLQPNTTETDRSAEVKVSLADGRSMSFNLIQKNYYPELIADNEDNQIIWEESFVLYRDAGTTELIKSIENQFSFVLSDDFSKGAYKIEGMFYSDQNQDGPISVSSEGGVYYADMEGNVLTVYKEYAPKRSYFFEDLSLTYDKGNKKLTIASVIKASVTGFSDAGERYIKDYKAVIKGSKQEDADVVVALFGTYRETFTGGYPAPSPKYTVISASGNLDYELKIEFFKDINNPYVSSYSYDVAYGNVNDDGTVITVKYPANTNLFNPEEMGGKSFDINVSGDNLSSDFAGKFTYTAVKENNK